MAAVLEVTVAQVIMGEDHPLQALAVVCTSPVCLDATIPTIPLCFTNSTHRIQVMAAQAQCGLERSLELTDLVLGAEPILK